MSEITPEPVDLSRPPCISAANYDAGYKDGRADAVAEIVAWLRTLKEFTVADELEQGTWRKGEKCNQ